jgi:nitrite reductase (NADH) large subunit
MQRFSHFVNSDDKDDNIEYVPVRDKKCEILEF